MGVDVFIGPSGPRTGPSRECPDFPLDLFSAFFLARFLERIFRPKLPQLSPQSPKWSQNASQNCPRGSSGCNFVIFLISMPLPRKIGVFVVPRRQKSSKNRTKLKKKKTIRKKHAPGQHFFVKKTIFDRKVLQNRSRDGGERTTFFVTFSPLDPRGRPRSTQECPGIAQGGHGT